MKLSFGIKNKRSKLSHLLTIFLITIFTLLFINSCSNTIVSPEDQPGRRDYEWTVDTLENLAPYNGYFCMGGSSPTDVWAAGNIGDGDKILLHYNGEKWSVFYYPPQGEWIDAWSIYCFSENSVWIGAQSGALYNYKNGEMIKYGPYILEGFETNTPKKFWANSEKDIYAVGNTYNKDFSERYGTILHYDGASWKFVLKPKIEGNFFDIKRGLKDSKSYFLLCRKIGIVDTVSIYEFDSRELKLLKKDTWEPSLLVVNDNIYFFYDKKIYKYTNGKFNVFKDLSTFNIKLMKIFSRTLNDFFINTVDGIGHYNGNDIETIFKLNEEIWIWDAAIFKEEVFFLLSNNTYNKFYIIHGRLKNQE